MTAPPRISQVRPLPRPRPRPARPGFLIALLVVGLSAAGWWVWGTQRQLRDLQGARTDLARRAAALRDTLSLLRSPGTRVLQIPVSTNGRAGAVTIFADSVSRRWLVSVSGLSPNAPGEAYQLWYWSADGARSAAVLPVAGDLPVVLALAVPAEVTGVAMTIEPRAGSSAPTGPMVFRVTL